MWLEILINVPLATAGIWTSVVFSSNISIRLSLNQVNELALTVVLLAVLGYLGFLFSWLEYVLNSNQLMNGFRIFLLVSALVMIFQNRPSEQSIRLVILSTLTTFVAVTTALCRGIADKNQGIQHTLAVRYWVSIDNSIPGIFAHALQNKQPLRPEILAGWQGSDRPPIATGLVRVFSPLTHTLSPDFFIICSSSSVLIFAVVALTRVIWERRGLSFAIGISMATYFCPGIFINVVYTWPKIIAASLTLVAVAVLCQSGVRDKNGISKIYLTTFAITLALLTHGSSIFVVPILLILLVFNSTMAKKHFTLASLLSVIIYLPWFLYQQYWDPPGNRLLFWHLAGQLEGGKGGILSGIWENYKQLSFGQVVQNKLWNVQSLLFQSEGNPGVAGYSGLLRPYRQLFSESVVGAIGILGWLGLIAFFLFGLRDINKARRIVIASICMSALTFCVVEYGESFSTRASLHISPMMISIGLAVLAFGALIEHCGVGAKLVIVLSLANVVLLGPLQPTAAAIGWGLEIWDFGTIALLAISVTVLFRYAFMLINLESNLLDEG